MGIDPGPHDDTPLVSLSGNTEVEERSAVEYILRRFQDTDERTAILAALGLTTASAGLLALGRHIAKGPEGSQP
ncbi:hypothetical protein ACIBEA_30120 [Streptomyces sp. NPDC051555]|uniref:hypothetical protein n=1 Tax=Streptomyces sp. NPDC051555 TaxID=3365657 RepID=UPI003789E4FB